MDEATAPDNNATLVEPAATTPLREIAISPTPAVLYETNKPQRIPFEVAHRGKKYRVAHVFGPLTDDLLVEYDRRCEVRYGEAERKEADGGRAVARSAQNFDAAVWLWNQLIRSVEGYSQLEGVDWRSGVKDKYKAAAIDTALLAAAIETDDQLPDAEEDECLPFNADDAATVCLRALYAGREVLTEHVMREPSAEQMSRFQSLNSRALVVKGRRFGKAETRIPSKARPLARLYDELCESSSGYEGGVPLHHKVAVIAYHLSAEQEVLGGN